MRDEQGDRLVIVHVCGYYAPGLGYQENMLPFAQAALGHEVHIVTGDRYFPHPRYDDVYAPQLGPRHVGAGTHCEGAVTVHRLPVVVEFARRQNPLLSGLVHTVRRLEPDVIHLHGVTPLTSLMVLLSALPRRSRIAVDHHLCGFNMAPVTPLKKAYYWVFRHLILPPMRHRVSVWLPINEDAAGVLSRWLGIGGPEVRISRLGADIGGLPHDTAAGDRWRERENIPANAKMIVFCGKVERRKEVHRLIEAFLARGRPDELLVIAGTGDETYLRELRHLAAPCAAIRFTPVVPHDGLCAFFNAATLAVWPGDPAITLIEAMACGTPVLLADPPGIDYVGQCDDVVTFKRGDVDTLTAAIGECLDQAPGDRAEKGESLSTFVRETLSWEAIAAQTVSYYLGQPVPAHGGE